MRMYAILENPFPLQGDRGGLVRKLMLYADKRDRTSLFLYTTVLDAACCADYDYPSLRDALEYCQEDFGLPPDGWTVIGDPQEGCQHDRIAPVRVKGRDTGEPEWGRLELFDGERWADYGGEPLKTADNLKKGGGGHG